MTPDGLTFSRRARFFRRLRFRPTDAMPDPKPAIVASLLFVFGWATAAVPGDALAELLPGANSDRGKAAFRKCRLCHTLEREGAAKLGPNLYGTVGAPVGASPEFAKYSDALLAFGGRWTPERLDAYLASPRTAVPGTTMVFVGLPDARDRADLIAYLNSMSDAPVEF